MVQGKGKKQRHKRNALSNMEKYENIGPMGELLKYKQQRTRIKVNNAFPPQKKTLDFSKIEFFLLIFLKKFSEIFFRFFFVRQVQIRNKSSITGHVTGIIEVFDKHWNLVLSDVHEVWRRRKTHLCTTADHVSEKHNLEAIDEERVCLARLRSLGIEMPTVAVKSLNRRFAECSRRLAQLMIRGEQIALITVDRNAEMPLDCR